MQNSIQKDIETAVNMEESSDYDTESSEDDIISYKQKTSIISSNLATISEAPKKKNKKRVEKQEIADIHKVKVVPEKRNREETKEERKERKQKVKEMKKQKKNQKKEFMEQFANEQKKMPKDKNPFHRVSCVKIV